MSTQDDIRAIALTEFSTTGYVGTSIQRIAEIAGLSKSSVLYHFASKETLLDAAISPAIGRLEKILERAQGEPFTGESRSAFIVQFVDFLLESRLEVNMFLNHGPSLEDVPVIDRANALVVRLANYFNSTATSTEGVMRFGMALGGAAFILCSANKFGADAAFAEPPVDEVRTALITIVTELLAPLTVAPTSIRE